MEMERSIEELSESRADEEIEEVQIGVEESIEIEAYERHTEEEYPHQESSLETDTSMSDIDDEASVQAQL
jgi:hypothetical protein